MPFVRPGKDETLVVACDFGCLNNGYLDVGRLLSSSSTVQDWIVCSFDELI